MTPATTPAQLDAALRWRYATKAFDTRPIPADVWKVLEQSLQLAPSSYGLQPWKFLVVTDAAKRALLRPNSWGQSQVTDASHLVVFTRQTSVNAADVQAFFDQMVSERRADPAKLEPYRQMMLQNVAQGMPAERQREWAARQVYIALGQFMAAAAVLGVDTCPLEGIDPAKYDEILGLKGTRHETVVACAAGYRSAEDKYAGMAKIRRPLDQVVVRV